MRSMRAGYPGPGALNATRPGYPPGSLTRADLERGSEER